MERRSWAASMKKTCCSFERAMRSLPLAPTARTITARWSKVSSSATPFGAHGTTPASASSTGEALRARAGSNCLLARRADRQHGVREEKGATRHRRGLSPVPLPRRSSSWAEALRVSPPQTSCVVNDTTGQSPCSRRTTRLPSIGRISQRISWLARRRSCDTVALVRLLLRAAHRAHHERPRQRQKRTIVRAGEQVLLNNRSSLSNCTSMSNDLTTTGWRRIHSGQMPVTDVAAVLASHGVLDLATARWANVGQARTLDSGTDCSLGAGRD